MTAYSESETFGRWLTARMRACGYATDGQLAADMKKLGGRSCSHTTVSRWKRDQAQITPEMCRPLASALRTPILEVFVRAGIMSEEEAHIRPGALPASEPVHAVVARVAEVVRKTQAHPDGEFLTEGLAHAIDDAVYRYESMAQGFIKRLATGDPRSPQY